MEELAEFLRNVKELYEEVKDNASDTEYNDGYTDALIFIIEWLEELT